MKKCEHCGAPLVERQRLFCGKRCARAWRYRNNPSFRNYQLRYSERRWARIRAEQSPDTPTAHRSKMEARILRPLVECGLARHEPVSLAYTNARGEKKAYKPDAVLVAKGIAVELKIELRQRDRDKMLAVKRDNPDIDIRFVLAWPNGRVGRGASAITQAQWCERHGFLWADNDIPQAWLNERPRIDSLVALSKARVVRHTEKHADAEMVGRVNNVMMKRRHVHECRRKVLWRHKRA